MSTTTKYRYPVRLTKNTDNTWTASVLGCEFIVTEETTGSALKSLASKIGVPIGRLKVCYTDETGLLSDLPTITIQPLPFESIPDPVEHAHDKSEAAMRFVGWMRQAALNSPEILKQIENFRKAVAEGAL